MRLIYCIDQFVPLLNMSVKSNKIMVLNTKATSQGFGKHVSPDPLLFAQMKYRSKLFAACLKNRIKEKNQKHMI